MAGIHLAIVWSILKTTMKEQTKSELKRLREIKQRLHRAADELSAELNGAPVVVVAGGSTPNDCPATVAGWSHLVDGREGRFRDVVGILQTAIQFESFAHYMEDDLFQSLKESTELRTWFSSRWEE